MPTFLAVLCEFSWVDALGAGRSHLSVLCLVQLFSILRPSFPHHFQFSQHAFVSVTHLIPSLFLGWLPAACVYLIVLWCHLIIHTRGFMGQTRPCLPYNWISWHCGDGSEKSQPSHNWSSGMLDAWELGSVGIWHRASSFYDKLGKSHQSCAASHSI